MSLNAKLLLIEDEAPLVEGLRYSLERDGYEVIVAMDGEAGLEAVAKQSPDLILLDVMLPKMDGIEVCRNLRQEGFTGPILMLTSRAEELDCVVGLEVGADDYITKPFRTRELIARVRAHLRRQNRGDKAAKLNIAGLTIDPSRREVHQGPDKIELAPREYDLLIYLAQNPDRVLSHNALIQEVWGYACGGDSSLVTVAVGRLREKLQPNRCIVTVRGSGYMLDSR